MLITNYVWHFRTYYNQIGTIIQNNNNCVNIYYDILLSILGDNIFLIFLKIEKVVSKVRRDGIIYMILIIKSNIK